MISLKVNEKPFQREGHGVRRHRAASRLWSETPFIRPIMRMSETPEIEVHIVKSSEKIGGIGEPGVPPAAPAVANALFNATGARVRRLPLTPAAVLEAMKKV